MHFFDDDSVCSLLKNYIYIRYYRILTIIDIIAEHIDQWNNKSKYCTGWS